VVNSTPQKPDNIIRDNEKELVCKKKFDILKDKYVVKEEA